MKIVQFILRQIYFKQYNVINVYENSINEYDKAEILIE